MTTDTIISRVWSFCTTLRDDGDYWEQLTYLIFLNPLLAHRIISRFACYEWVVVF